MSGSAHRHKRLHIIGTPGHHEDGEGRHQGGHCHLDGQQPDLREDQEEKAELIIPLCELDRETVWSSVLPCMWRAF